MERKPPETILQLKAVCIMLPFVLITKAPGPPRRARGLPSFIYMISIMPMNVLFHLIFYLAPGSTSRPGDLPP